MEKIAHLDAADSAFLYRQLEAMKSTVFEVKRQDLKARDIFPRDPDNIDPGATHLTYEVMDSVGVAKLISSYADDLPRVDIKTKEFQSPLRPIATAFGYNIDEIAAARFANKDLNRRKAQAATRAAEQIIHDVAMRGDADLGLPGFLTNPNIPVVDAEDIGAGVTEWSNKTGEQILDDLNDLVNGVSDNTNGVETADTLLLPVAQFNLITVKKLADSDMSVLKWFMENNPYIQNIDWVPELSTADSAGTGPRAVAYRRDPEVLTLEIPKEPQFLPPQARNLETVVPVHGKIGGVIVYLPLACRFMDSI